MKERVGHMVGEVVEGMPWLGTFHSIGAKILRRHAELVGLKPDFTILDTDDQIRLLKQLLAAENIDEKRWPARVLASQIDGWKNRGLTPEQVPAGEAAAFADGRGQRLYAAYQARLKTLNAADFGDLLLETIRLFRDAPGGAAPVSGAVSLYPGRRVPGHQCRAISVAAPAGAAPDIRSLVIAGRAIRARRRRTARHSASSPGRERSARKARRREGAPPSAGAKLPLIPALRPARG